MRYNPFCHKHHLQNPQTILDTGPLICHSIQQRLKRSAAWFGYVSFSIGTWTTVSWNNFPEEKKNALYITSSSTDRFLNLRDLENLTNVGIHSVWKFNLSDFSSVLRY